MHELRRLLAGKKLPLAQKAGDDRCFDCDHSPACLARDDHVIGKSVKQVHRRGTPVSEAGWINHTGLQIKKRGGILLITARFIPGGRTILTVSSGITQQPRLWFAAWVAIAGTIWATYAAGLGFLFGQAFEDDHAIAFWLAFGTALGLTFIVEVIRWIRERGKEQQDPVIAHADDGDRTLER